MIEDILEVINVGRVTDFTTGNLIHQIQFGHTVEVNDQMRKGMPQPMGSAPVREQASIVLMLMVKFEDAVPYRLGTRWKLNITDQGAITLKEAK